MISPISQTCSSYPPYDPPKDVHLPGAGERFPTISFPEGTDELDLFDEPCPSLNLPPIATATAAPAVPTNPSQPLSLNAPIPPIASSVPGISVLTNAEEQRATAVPAPVATAVATSVESLSSRVSVQPPASATSATGVATAAVATASSSANKSPAPSSNESSSNEDEDIGEGRAHKRRKTNNVNEEQNRIKEEQNRIKKETHLKYRRELAQKWRQISKKTNNAFHREASEFDAMTSEIEASMAIYRLQNPSTSLAPFAPPSTSARNPGPDYNRKPERDRIAQIIKELMADVNQAIAERNSYRAVVEANLSVDQWGPDLAFQTLLVLPCLSQPKPPTQSPLQPGNS